MRAILTFLGLSIFLGTCSNEQDSKYIQFPADNIVKELDAIQNFSIILYDMNLTEDGKYMHKYKVIKQTKNIDMVSDSSSLADSSATAADLGFEESITDWKEVSAADFDFHSSDMGMEIVSKVNGKVSKVATPPGYSQYVGNEKYGQWKTNPNSGDRFWSFYGRYMFINSMFRLMSPVPYGYYSPYYNSYRGMRPYYGPSMGKNTYAYGTGSSHSKSMNSKFSQRMKSNSALKTRVNNSVSQSSSRATGGKRTAATTQRTRHSRSSSRYKGTSSRSRSWGGGGK